MWSDTVSIRTKTFIVSIPTILTPSNNSRALPVNLLITTSAFNYMVLATLITVHTIKLVLTKHLLLYIIMLKVLLVLIVQQLH